MVIFSLKDGKPLWKEALDQSGHMVFAACLMAAFVWEIPVWVAPLLVMIVAFERELEQHGWRPVDVGKQDLFFWAVSCALFVAVYYAV